MLDAIHVGESQGKTFSLPLDVQTVTTAVLGIRGTGKTNTAGVVAEGLLRSERQVVIVDPTDAWWGLKASRDGKHEGQPILVIGGDHGDIPLSERDGATIADFLVEERVSAVLSVRHLRKGQFRGLVTELTEQLFYRKGKPEFRTPLLYIIDECDQFIPQKVGGAEARMVGAVEDVVRRGRNAGLGCMLISQRAASVNKDVLTQLELLIAHRHTSPQDRKALLEWVQAHDVDDRQKEFMESLASMERGEAWFWSPGWLDVFARVKVNLRATFDSSATPKAGERIAAPKKLAEVDLARIRGKLSASIERAKADDPRELKRRIAELEKKIKATAESTEHTEKKTRVEVKRVEVPVVKDAQIKRLEAAIEKLRGAEDNVAKEVNVITAAMRGAQREGCTNPLPSNKPAVTIERAVLAPVRKAPPARRESNADYSGSNGSELKRPQQRILNAIAWWNSIGVDAPTRSMVGFVAGIKPTGGHFSNSIGPLSSQGLIAAAGEGVTLTSQGAALASAPERAPTLAEYHDQIRGILRTGAQQRILDAVIEAGGEIAIEKLGEETGIDPSGGHFSNSIGPLGTLGLIDRRAGMVRPTRLLFPEGLG